jgi:hypothetical protein
MRLETARECAAIEKKTHEDAIKSREPAESRQHLSARPWASMRSNFSRRRTASSSANWYDSAHFVAPDSERGQPDGKSWPTANPDLSELNRLR